MSMALVRVRWSGWQVCMTPRTDSSADGTTESTGWAAFSAAVSTSCNAGVKNALTMLPLASRAMISASVRTFRAFWKARLGPVCLAAALALVAVAGTTRTGHAEPPRRVPAAALPAAIANGVFLSGDELETTVVIDLSRPVNPTVSALTAPHRLLVDFADTGVHASSRLPVAVNRLVTGVRFGQHQGRQARLVLDLSQPARLLRQDLVAMPQGGSRLVLRLAAAGLVSAAIGSGEAGPGAAPDDDLVTGSTQLVAAGESPAAKAPKQARSAIEKPLIVLDPGHGGIDPGATGADGVSEKVIVLNFALALRDRLEAGGRVRVQMTRSTDVFLPLRDRVRIARTTKAALFISVHADSLDEADVRGATIYTLSERASDERSQRLADKENRADLLGGVEIKDDQDDVADILIDLARRETRTFSNTFARSLVGYMQKVTRMHRIPQRSAGFRVLKAPDVPSVLIELGYLSSPDELKLLNSDSWRTTAADAVAVAIEQFVTTRLTRGDGD